MAFLDDFDALRHSIPFPAIRGQNNEDCEFVAYGFDNKYCFYCTTPIGMERGIYCRLCGLSKYLVDCYLCAWSELCYECVDTLYCYGCTYLFDSTKCQNCHFSSLLVDCTDCFGCVALTHKKYCIFNKQFTPEEYAHEVAKLNQKPADEILARLMVLAKQTPRPQSNQRDNVNCPYGDYLSFSKNVFWGFNTYYLEDSGYFFQGGIAKNCWDCFMVGGGGTAKTIMDTPCELCYECAGCGLLYNCAFLFQCNNCTNCFYGWDLNNCTDCLGCVGLTNKKYCILNNQLTKEQYEEGIRLIRQELGWSTPAR